MTDPNNPIRTDHLVEPTGNGLRPDDPIDQPSQDPGVLPDGTLQGDQ